MPTKTLIFIKNIISYETDFSFKRLRSFREKNSSRKYSKRILYNNNNKQNYTILERFIACKLSYKIPALFEIKMREICTCSVN